MNLHPFFVPGDRFPCLPQDLQPMDDGDLDVLNDFLLRVSVCTASGQRGTEGPIASVLFRQHDGVGIGIHCTAPPFDPASSSVDGSPMKRSGKRSAPGEKPLRRKG